jgi:hypothetical protein
MLKINTNEMNQFLHEINHIKSLFESFQKNNIFIIKQMYFYSHYSIQDIIALPIALINIVTDYLDSKEYKIRYCMSYTGEKVLLTFEIYDFQMYFNINHSYLNKEYSVNIIHRQSYIVNNDINEIMTKTKKILYKYGFDHDNSTTLIKDLKIIDFSKQFVSTVQTDIVYIYLYFYNLVVCLFKNK